MQFLKNLFQFLSCLMLPNATQYLRLVQFFLPSPFVFLTAGLRELQRYIYTFQWSEYCIHIMFKSSSSQQILSQLSYISREIKQVPVRANTSTTVDHSKVSWRLVFSVSTIVFYRSKFETFSSKKALIWCYVHVDCGSNK